MKALAYVRSARQENNERELVFTRQLWQSDGLTDEDVTLIHCEPQSGWGENTLTDPQQRLLAEIASGKYEVLYLTDLARFSRREDALMSLLLATRDSGISVRLATGVMMDAQIFDTFLPLWLASRRVTHRHRCSITGHSLSRRFHKYETRRMGRRKPV